MPIFSEHKYRDIFSAIYRFAKNIAIFSNIADIINTDTVASFLVRIARMSDELQGIDEIVPEKELLITALLGLPTSWSAFASRINSWKDTPTFDDLKVTHE